MEDPVVTPTRKAREILGTANVYVVKLYFVEYVRDEFEGMGARQVVGYDDTAVVFEETADQMGSDETNAACNQNPHVLL